MPFYIDDVLTEPFVIEPPETIDLTAFIGAVASIRDPLGIVTPLDAEIADDDTSVIVDFPADETVFAEPGVYVLEVIVTDGTAGMRRFPDLRVVAVDPASEWHTLDTIRAEWPDADAIPDPTLWELLEVVRHQVLEYAPVLEDGAPVPAAYRLGQRVQARNTWNASRVAPDGGIGEGDFVVRPYPLDWHVRQILRPKSGRPVLR